MGVEGVAAPDGVERPFREVKLPEVPEHELGFQPLGGEQRPRLVEPPLVSF